MRKFLISKSSKEVFGKFLQNAHRLFSRKFWFQPGEPECLWTRDREGVENLLKSVLVTSLDGFVMSERVAPEHCKCSVSGVRSNLMPVLECGQIECTTQSDLLLNGLNRLGPHRYPVASLLKSPLASVLLTGH